MRTLPTGSIFLRQKNIIALLINRIMQNVGLSVRGFDSSVDSVWLIAIYLPIIKCFELLEDWHYLYKCLWTYPFLSWADRLSRRVPLVWDTPWLCVNGRTAWSTCPVFPGQLLWGAALLFNKVCLKNTPITSCCFGFEESYYLNVDIQAGLLESQMLPALTWSPVSWQLAGPGPAIGRIQVGQHNLIFSQTQHNHILVVSATALFHREIK